MLILLQIKFQIKSTQIDLILAVSKIYCKQIKIKCILNSDLPAQLHKGQLDNDAFYSWIRLKIMENSVIHQFYGVLHFHMFFAYSVCVHCKAIYSNFVTYSAVKRDRNRIERKCCRFWFKKNHIGWKKVKMKCQRQNDWTVNGHWLMEVIIQKVHVHDQRLFYRKLLLWLTLPNYANKQGGWELFSMS